MNTEKILIENIEITLKRKNIKNMYLRVLPPSGEVVISAPLFVSDDDIANFVKFRKDWIEKKQQLILNNKIQAPLKYKSGERHLLWGKEYTLQLVSRNELKKIAVDYENSIIYLPVEKRSKKETREKRLNELYRQELKNCRYQDKRITLNLKLAKKNPICLEYVMIHELCHLIEFNHGKKFKKLMDEFCPNWKKIKKILNE